MDIESIKRMNDNIDLNYKIKNANIVKLNEYYKENQSLIFKEIEESFYNFFQSKQFPFQSSSVLPHCVFTVLQS